MSNPCDNLMRFEMELSTKEAEVNESYETQFLLPDDITVISNLDDVYVQLEVVERQAEVHKVELLPQHGRSCKNVWCRDQERI